MIISIKKRKGFTLIELLVVISIIGILATGVFSVYSSMKSRARDSVRLKDLSSFEKGIDEYHIDFLAYPKDSEEVKELSNMGFIEILPIDPSTGEESDIEIGGIYNYYYYVGTNNQGFAFAEYELSALLEEDNARETFALPDGGNHNERYEIGIDISVNNTNGENGNILIKGENNTVNL